MERQAKDQGAHMDSMTRALATLNHLTPALAGLSNPLNGAVLAALTAARTAAERHWSDAAAAANIAMQACSEALAAEITPSWRELLPAHADWQILIATCGQAILKMGGGFVLERNFSECKEAG